MRRELRQREREHERKVRAAARSIVFVRLVRDAVVWVQTCGGRARDVRDVPQLQRRPRRAVHVVRAGQHHSEPQHHLRRWTCEHVGHAELSWTQSGQAETEAEAHLQTFTLPGLHIGIGSEREERWHILRHLANSGWCACMQIHYTN